ncbi:thioredoxin family protein [Algoriphagus machipongonensis]|uniref:Probable protein disulfide-isomerase n=1 Tax=Algoriphagus machipongonensis TaxID=388413 RepID=A3HT71_9BACT|nr:thioredoxin fold domain-containing protein [Algoriphagus machipongonensis]EAZ83039.1 probable protein disulfide-isomerase [Algoriphagus machipongonensis]
MKKLILLISFVLIGITVQAQEKIEWMKFEEAVAANQKDPKMLLVDVYTDWCGWCKKMDALTFKDPEVVSYINERFYAVKLNAEDTERTFDFMGKEYSEAKMAAVMRVQSYPNFVIIDETLKNITQLPGYREPDQFLEGLGLIVKKGFRGQ